MQVYRSEHARISFSKAQDLARDYLEGCELSLEEINQICLALEDLYAGVSTEIEEIRSDSKEEVGHGD